MNIGIHANLELNYWCYFISLWRWRRLTFGPKQFACYIVHLCVLVRRQFDGMDTTWSNMECYGLCAVVPSDPAHTHTNIDWECGNRAERTTHLTDQNRQLFINGGEHVGINFNYTTFFGLMLLCMVYGRTVLNIHLYQTIKHLRVAHRLH